MKLRISMASEGRVKEQVSKSAKLWKMTSELEERVKYCDFFDIFRQMSNSLVLLAQLTAVVSGLVNQIQNNILLNTRGIYKGSIHTANRIEIGLH